MDGYFKLYRKITENPIFENPITLKFFIWCLSKSTYKEREVLINNQVIELEKGQFIFGRKKASLELNMSEQVVRTQLKILEKLNVISVKSTNKFSIITVINWGVYQCQEENLTNKQPTDNQQRTNNEPTDNQQITTNNKVKKDNKEKKDNKKENKELFVATKVATPKFENNSVEILTSKYLATKILKLNSNAKVPKTDAELQKWAKHVDLILRVDERPLSDLKEVLKFATTDTFWQSNILSTKKLRDKYDQLYLKMIKEREVKTNGSGARTFDSDDEYSAIKSFKL